MCRAFLVKGCMSLSLPVCVEVCVCACLCLGVGARVLFDLCMCVFGCYSPSVVKVFYTIIQHTSRNVQTP